MSNQRIKFISCDYQPN